MAQIIKHRRGSLEALSAVTSSLVKGEIVIASGSSNLTTTNGSSLVFAVPQDGQVQAVNRFLIGNSAPATFAGSTYNGMVNGVPFYDSGSGTLYLLGSDSNTAINLVGNIQPFSSSVASSINALSASIGSGTIGTSVTLLNAFTASAGIRLNNLESTSASVNTSITNINGHIADINAYTASNNTTNTTQNGRLTNLESTSASVNTSIASINGHIVDINTKTGSFESKFSTLATYTASVDGRLTNLESTSASVLGHIADINAYTASNNTTNTTQNNRLTSLESQTGSYASTTVGNTFNGNQVVSGSMWITGSLTVYGSSSFANVTASAVNIGTNTVILNTANPAVRFGGIKVIDSGSSASTGSLLWDSQNNVWLYQNPSGSSYTSARLIAGPKNNGNLGDEIGLTTGKLVVASGDDHISDSIVTQTAGKITIDGGLDVTGSISASSIVGIGNVTTYSTSVDSRLASVESSLGGGGSIGTRVSLLEAFTGSQETKNSTLATYTASVDARFTNIETFTGSQEAKNTTLATYTASVNSRLDQLSTVSGSNIGRLNNLELTSASVNGHIANINSYTASNDTLNSLQTTRIDQLASLTSSVNSRLDQLSTDSGSQNTRITTLETKAGTLATYTASVDGHISDINSWSASVKGHIADINAYTSSNNTTNTAQNNRLTTIEAFTSSFSTSVNSRITTLEGTGTIQGLGTGNNVTFAKVTTTGDVIVGGDLVVQGNTTTLNTAQLVIEDKLITLASGSTSNATADGAGFEVAGTSASFKYDGVKNNFSSSIDIVSNITGSLNVPGYGSSKRMAFRNAAGNIDFVAAPTTTGDIAQWNGTDFVMSNVIDGGSF